MEAFLPLLLLAALWLLMIRPQQQRVKRQRELLASLAVGDEVVTVGGILGRIVTLDDERVSVEVAPGTVLTMVRGAIGQRIDHSAEVDSPEPDPEGGGGPRTGGTPGGDWDEQAG